MIRDAKRYNAVNSMLKGLRNRKWGGKKCKE